MEHPTAVALARDQKLLVVHQAHHHHHSHHPHDNRYHHSSACKQDTETKEKEGVVIRPFSYEQRLRHLAEHHGSPAKLKSLVRMRDGVSAVSLLAAKEKGLQKGRSLDVWEGTEQVVGGKAVVRGTRKKKKKDRQERTRRQCSEGEEEEHHATPQGPNRKRAKVSLRNGSAKHGRRKRPLPQKSL